MEANLENYSKLINRLKTGAPSTFRRDLELLAQEFGSFRPLEDVARLSSENEELLGVSLEMIREYGQGNNPGSLLFHATRRIGPKVIPNIREEWQKNIDGRGLHYLHMCLMDIIGASRNEKDSQQLMPIIAGREIPLWIELLRATNAASRGLLAWALGALAKYAPAPQSRHAGEAIINFLYDGDISVQNHVVRGLLYMGDKNLLQDGLFRLARVAEDQSALALLLSVSEAVDVKAKDAWGKTALDYAEESGNEKIAAMLKNAGAADK